ncbi:hypothetical protein DCC39_06925 [Pueribacillus theae]|uniref:Sodium:solute symporter n=1 Tax=Pueribacillus theae TaxID=2171751 RepID=A0A2U1K3P5_9BACI|nr:sodium:solute symporter family protein [Pueribacillus theae]PWA12160.1 hypothetical protein DCC39_06925 [Pueribacillus theae]
MGVSAYIVFIGYLLLVIVIGYLTSKGSEKQFLVAGQNQPYWVVGAGYVATYLSAASFLATPGLVYHQGFMGNGAYLGSVFGYMGGLALFGPMLRRFGKVTIPDFLGDRYDSNVVRALSACLIFVGYFLYISVEIIGIAFLFELMFGVSYLTAIFIAMAVILIYTVLGGMMATAFTDVFQHFFTWISAVIVGTAAMINVGGVSGLVNKITELHPDFLTISNGTGDATLIWGLFFTWVIGTLARADTISRAYLAKSEREVYKAVLFATPFIWICTFFFLLVGLMGAVLFPGLDGTQAEQVYLIMADKVVFPIFTGLAFAGFLASAQSTTSGQLMVSALAVGRDIYGRLVGPLLKKRPIDDKEVVRVTRLAILVMSVLSFLFAAFRFTWMLDIITVSMAIMGPAFLVTWLGGFFWKRATRAGAIAAMVVGSVTASYTQITDFSIEAVPWLVAPLFSLIITVIAFIVVSMISSPSEKSLQVYKQLRRPNTNKIGTKSDVGA